MCTAISETAPRHLFGRTLDLECSYGESVVLTPRHYRFPGIPEGGRSAALLGVAHMADGIPLYYDAMNEHGLCGAALNFPGCAVYRPTARATVAVPSAYLLPYVLTRAKNVAEARLLLSRVTVTSAPVSETLPPTPLHWIFADKSGCIAVESLKTGTVIYENSARVLTNAPPFPYHLYRAADHASLSPHAPKNRLSPSVPLAPYSRGMGAMGLPGDLSSVSRFVRALYMKANTLPADEKNAVRRFFHILATVAVPLGTTIAENGLPVGTVYTSCADPDKGCYHVLIADQWQPFEIRFDGGRCDGDTPTVYPLAGAEIPRLLQ